MAKDLIVGGASGYNWNQLRYWVNSIKKTGFKGDIVLVATNMSGDTVKRLVEEDVKVFAYGNRSEDGGIAKTDNNIPPHVERFIFIWDFLRKNKDTYRFVTVTDTRDVIFQKDPTEYLEKNLMFGAATIVCASEGLAYKDEPWGSKNLLDTFGPLVYDELKDNEIYNVGTIAGFYDEVKDLLLQIFFQSVNRPIPIVDQAVFNFIISLAVYDLDIVRTSNESGWAIQLGTTLEAIKAGAGDIGQIVRQDPSKLDEYIKVYKDTQPVVKDDLVTNDYVPFTIVHQWDRVPAIRDLVEKVYGDGKCEEVITLKTH
jgi:hypothetical protein